MTLYLWIKALHLISVISWMAGMLYLPRLYVYHCQVQTGSEEDSRFQLMERRLLRVIINPAMFASFGFGIWLIAIVGMQHGWLHAKLALLVLMMACHGFLARWRKQFARGENQHGEKFYRMINEVPTVLMVLIVILAVVKPF